MSQRILRTVPAALLISAFAPWAVIPLLMLGGAYLCFEGFEKIAHKYLPHDDEHADEAAQHAEQGAGEQGGVEVGHGATVRSARSCSAPVTAILNLRGR